MWEENIVGKDGGMSQLVMVIDDSPTVRRVMEVCLGRAGYEVASFPEGVTALRWLQTPEMHLPGLVFLDIEMPGMDGYYVAQYLHARPQYRHIVIVLLSGYNGVLDRLKGRLAGAQQYLTKPCRTQVILAVVQAYLGPLLLMGEEARGSMKQGTLAPGEWSSQGKEQACD